MLNKGKKNGDIAPVGLSGAFFAVAGVAIAFMVIFLAVISFAPTYSLAIGLVLIVVYTLGVGIYIFAAQRGSDASLPDTSISPLLGNIMNNTMMNLNFPAFIADEKEDVIIWSNRSADEMSRDKKNLRGAKTEDIFAVSAAEIVSSETEELKSLTAHGRTFAPSGYRIKLADRSLIMLVLYEETELAATKAEMASRELIISYVMIDNLEEMLQNEQETYRAVATKIDGLLRELAGEAGGILKEYERDRYLFVFEASALDEFINRKFDILDRVRDVRVGNGNLPVTVSVGISTVKGSFSDREKAAQAALDMALQRGGDQVVLKSESAIEFFGGRSKTVQKRTKVRARVTANELLMRMSRASNVLIMGHKYADFDALGAAVGIARLAMLCGVRVNILSNPRDVNLDGCRAMLMKDEDYADMFIDGATALDMLRSDTLLVIVDVNNFALLECPELAVNCNDVVIIDHHRKTAEFEREPVIQYIEPSASATCEIVAEMLEQVLPTGQLSRAEANLLFAGIQLDTKQFTKNTGTRTFGAAMYLRDRGASPAEAQELFKTDIDEFTREAKFRSNIVVYRNIVAISLGEGEGDAGDRIAAAKAADRLLEVSGVQASFALIKIGDAVQISARSTGAINVQLILEELKGGGHFDAAGAQVQGGTLSETLVMLKEAIDKFLDSKK